MSARRFEMMDPVEMWWQWMEAVVFFWFPDDFLLDLMGL